MNDARGEKDEVYTRQRRIAREKAKPPPNRRLLRPYGLRKMIGRDRSLLEVQRRRGVGEKKNEKNVEQETTTTRQQQSCWWRGG